MSFPADAAFRGARPRERGPGRAGPRRTTALVRSYWRPVYLYIRLRWRRGAEDAQDLTQEFFARAFEREYLERYDPAKARFRTFVRTCLDGFLANDDKAAGAPQARRRIRDHGGRLRARRRRPRGARAPTIEPDPELWFHREWIRGLFGDAVDALRARAPDRRARRRLHAVPCATTSRTPTTAPRPDVRDARARDRASASPTSPTSWRGRAARSARSSSTRLRARVRERRGVPRRGARSARSGSAVNAVRRGDRAAAAARRSSRLRAGRATSCSRRSAAAGWGSSSARAIASSIATSRSR